MSKKTHDVPDYLVNLAQQYRDWLVPENWAIHIEMVATPNHDPNASAAAHNDVLNHKTTIQFGIDSNPEDAHYEVIHEMLHVTHAMVDDLVDSIILLLDPQARELAGKTYETALEQFIDSLAKGVLKMHAGLEKQINDTT